MGNKVLAKLSLQLPPEHHRSEHQPGCDILQWPRLKNQLVRLIFARNWPRHQSSICITMRTMTKHQIKRENNENMAIVSSCYPRAKTFLAHESLLQTVNICSTNAIHAKRVHSYCICSPGVYWCAECFGYHLACTENNLSTPG